MRLLHPVRQHKLLFFSTVGCFHTQREIRHHGLLVLLRGTREDIFSGLILYRKPGLDAILRGEISVSLLLRLEENAQAKPSLPERQPPERPFFEL